MGWAGNGRRSRRCLAGLVGAFLLFAVVGPAVAIDPPKKSDDSPLEWFAKQANAAWSIAWSILLTTAVIIFVTGAVVVLRREFRRTSMVIDPIDVPTDLAAKGYTPIVVAQRIAAELARLQRRARVQGRRLEDAVELSTLQIDFNVPTAGISYRTMLRYVRQSFGRPEQRVRGEIIREKGQSSGGVVFDLFGSRPDPLRIVLRTAANEETPDDLKVDSEAQLPGLLERAALAIATLVDPYLIAAYWFRVEQADRRFDKTLQAVSLCFRRTRPEDHYRAYVTWGNVLSAQRKFAEAEDKFAIAAALAPHAAAVYNSHGNVLRTTRRLDDAARMYQHALRLDRRDAPAWSNLGNVCNDRRLYEQAISCFERALRIDPNFVSPLSGWGYALWRLGRVNEAERRFSQAVDIDPQFGWSHVNWARMLWSQHLYDQAIERIALASEALPADACGVWGDILRDAGRVGEAERKYEEADKANPDLGIGPAGMAGIFLRQRRATETIAASRRALETNPYHWGASGSLLSGLRLSRQHEAAIEAAQEFIARDPHQASVYVHWGQVLRAQDKPREALSYFELASQRDPTDAWAWRSWGDALMDLGRPRRALRKFERAIAANPWDGAAYVSAGRALARLGRHDESIERFREACTADPRNDSVHRALAQRLRQERRYEEALDRAKIAVEVALQPADSLAVWGDILGDLGRYAEAQEKYDACLRSGPGGVRHHVVGTAFVMWHTGRHPEAVTKADEVLSTDPYDRGAWAQSVDALRFSGRYDEAIVRCRNLLAIRPRDATAHIVWGQVLRAQHHLDEAVRQFRRAIALDSRDSWAWFSLGEALMETARYDRAMSAFRRATIANPWQTGAWVRWGDCHATRGRLQEALKLYRRACEQDPRSGWAWRKQAATLWDLDRRQEGRQVIQRALESAPDAPDMLRQTADALMWDMNEKIEAAPIYRKAVLLDPRDVWAWRGVAAAGDAADRMKALEALQKIVASETWNADGHRALATVLESHLGTDAALGALERGAASVPQSVTVLRDWATALGRSAARSAAHDEDGAERLYAMAEAKLRQASEQDRWDPEPLIDWGWQLLTRKHYDLALERFTMAVQRDRYRGRAWWGKGRALAGLSRHRRAVRAYRRALKYGPNRAAIRLDLAASLRSGSSIITSWASAAASSVRRSLGRRAPDSSG
jgi:tetratricopeptide (TPR) repeat protein